MDSYESIEQFCADKYSKLRVSADKRKSIADFWLSDTHAVNVKSNNIAKKNYSPNLISASRAEDWLQQDKDISFIFVDYSIIDGKIQIERESDLIPIQCISWDCLTIQAQGKGVIQKRGSLKIEEKSKDDWILDMSKAYLLYVEREFNKLCEIEEKYSKIIQRNNNED